MVSTICGNNKEVGWDPAVNLHASFFKVQIFSKFLINYQTCNRTLDSWIWLLFGRYDYVIS